MTWRGFVIVGLLILLGLSSTAYAQEEPTFGKWLLDFRYEASKKGIPGDVLDSALSGLEVDDEVIRLDRKQPESTTSFTDYAARVVNDKRVEQGREMMSEYRPLLATIARKYNVQPRYIIALWGIETNYGGNTGNFSLVQSLATLAYEGRRADFFRKELMSALTILVQERMPADELTGSWAGAMGNCQFMPSTYLSYAVDWDGNGHRDVWNSVPDSLASIANYLHGLGWNGGMKWGRAVHVPADFDTAEADLKKPRSLADWSARGVTLEDGSPLTPSKETAYVVYPGQPDEGAYLVTDNYRALLQWNRSRYFATAVGLLADRIGE